MGRMLITGGKGMVGSYAQRVFPEHEILSTDLPELDICSARSVAEAFRSFRPEVVLHLAAATDVDRCEQDPDLAYRVNAIGTQNVALACRECGATLVYASTGSVFRGDKTRPYTEFDETCPSNVYAASKLAGETLARELAGSSCVVRAGWIFGGGAKDKKFVGKLAALIASGRSELRVVEDKIGTPTYAEDFLRGIRKLLEAGCRGVFHVGNQGSASRYHIAREIARILRREDIAIVPVSSAEFPLPAPRGVSEAIRNYKMELIGLPAQRPWVDALAAYLHEEVLPAMKGAPGR